MTMNTKTPRVSVIIATYDRPLLVRRAVQSVIDQTFGEWELLVVDDRGNPETETVVKTFASKDGRVHYVPNETRLGLMENKNKGVRLSSPASEYVAFLDDDDALLPRFLERTIAVMDSDPRLMAANTGVELRTQEGKLIKLADTVPDNDHFWKVRLGTGSVIRKTIFTKFNIWYDKDMKFEDWDFGIRVAKDHPWIAIPDVLWVYYRYHAKMGESMSTVYTKATPQSVLDALYRKYESVFRAAGPEAIALLHRVTGKMLLRADHVKAGRWHLWRSFCELPSISSFCYWLLSIIAPSAFKNLTLIIWKNRIKGMLKA